MWLLLACPQSDKPTPTPLATSAYGGPSCGVCVSEKVVASRYVWVEGGDAGIIPVLDLALEDGRQDSRVEHQLAIAYAWNGVDYREGAVSHGYLDHWPAMQSGGCFIPVQRADRLLSLQSKACCPACGPMQACGTLYVLDGTTSHRRHGNAHAPTESYSRCSS